MKHGPISLIDRDAVVGRGGEPGTRSWRRLLANIEEVPRPRRDCRGVIDEGDEETGRLVDSFFEVPAVDELLSPVVAVVPLQILAYAVARARGNDVDRPRNLAKVVTVE